jgi:hypothetical protein
MLNRIACQVVDALAGNVAQASAWATVTVAAC